MNCSARKPKRRGWHMTLDVSVHHKRYDNEEIGIEDFAKAVAATIRNLKPYKEQSENWGFEELADIEQRFECDTTSVKEFDDALSRLYDWGDFYRCWIAINDFTHQAAKQ